jgi:DNA-binding NarL/FixJ family response regulator
MLSESCGRRYREDYVFFSTDFANRKPYRPRVKKSPQTKGNADNPASKWELTPRELDVLELLRTGAADKEIASALGISRSTASKHVENILKKMKAPNRTAAAGLSWQK